MKKKEYNLMYGCKGNGTTVCDRNQTENGDYKNVAHISETGEITWYEKDTPESVKNEIVSVSLSKTEW